jgi:succinyl-CoA synthetase alpha subunit
VSILIDKKTVVLIQGITGREGRNMASLMKDYGTNVVAGVTPGRGGEEIDGIPVYNTVQEAISIHPNITASAVLVPARFAKSASLEAISAGVHLITLHPERMPQQDMLEVIAYSRLKKAIVIGPNTPGIISPGKSMVGMLGATASYAKEFFQPGQIGVLSRSGGNVTTVSYYLVKEGLGQSTAIGTGGDALVGTSWAELLSIFEKDDETKLVIAYGEIGTTQEEDAADLIRRGGYTKPFIVYIAGKYARQGVRFGHAGAIISNGHGTAESKKDALKNVGAHVVDHLNEISSIAEGYLN